MKRYKEKNSFSFYALKQWAQQHWKKLAIIGGCAAVAIVLLVMANMGTPDVDDLEIEPAQLDAKWTALDETVSLSGLKVVIDAGHGGSDAGTTGAFTGRLEKEVNLEIAKKLQAALVNEGMTVVMTRETDDAIAPTKDEDMQKRVDIILAERPDMFISIHQNRFDEEEAYGPQVFYLAEGTEGKKLAVSIMEALNEVLEIAQPRIALAGNYTLLKPGAQPSCIVECGFFSNEEEEKKLQQPEYQNNIVKAITLGVKLYVSEYLS